MLVLGLELELVPVECRVCQEREPVCQGCQEQELVCQGTPEQVLVDKVAVSKCQLKRWKPSKDLKVSDSPKELLRKRTLLVTKMKNLRQISYLNKLHRKKTK